MTTLTGLQDPLQNGAPGTPNLVQAGGLSIGLSRSVATYQGAPLGLTRIECAILDYLIRAAGGIVTRDELSKHLHRRPHGRLERGIDMHISHLRKKLAPAAGWTIRTVRGEGYQLVRTEAAAEGGPRRTG